ncbi:hypothetical protein ACXGQW_01625 [Wenyingzhuangia sp. IMCC45533]
MIFIKQLALSLPLVAHMSFAQVKRSSFLVCYSKLNVKEIKNYKEIFLEANFYSLTEINKLKQHNKYIYGYLSLSEVNKANTSLYNKLFPYLLESNDYWQSSYIDLSKKEARDLLLGEIAVLFEKNLDGVLLDNIDNLTAYGTYPEFEPYLEEMVKEIKSTFPQKKIFFNGGLFLKHPEKYQLSGIIIESLYTHYDFDAQKYRLSDVQRIKTRLQAFKQALKKANAKGYVIEYAEDKMMIENIKNKYKKTKYPYLITDIGLSLAY